MTVKPQHRQAFEALFAGQSCRCIGSVIDKPLLRITGSAGKLLSESALDALKAAWQAPLKEM